MAKKKMDKESIDSAKETLEELKENYALPGKDLSRVDEVLDELEKMNPSSKKKKKLSSRGSTKSVESKSNAKTVLDSLLKKPGIISYTTLKKYGIKFSVKGDFNPNSPHRLIRAGSGKTFLEQDDSTVEVVRSGNNFKAKPATKTATAKVKNYISAIESLVNSDEDFSDVDANNFIKKYDAKFQIKSSNIDFTKGIKMSRTGDVYSLSQGNTTASFKYSGSGKFKEVTQKVNRTKPKTSNQRRSTVTSTTSSTQTQSSPQQRRVINLKPEALPLQQLSQKLRSARDSRALYEIAIDEFHKRQDDLPILLQGRSPTTVLDSYERFLEEILVDGKNSGEIREVSLQKERLSKISKAFLSTAQKDIKDPIEITHLQELMVLVGLTIEADLVIRAKQRGKITKLASKINFGSLLLAMSGGNPLVDFALTTLGKTKDLFFNTPGGISASDKEKVFERDREGLRDKERTFRRKMIQNEYNGANSPSSLKSSSPSWASGMGDFLNSPIEDEIDFSVKRQPMTSITSGVGASSDTMSLILSELQLHTKLLEGIIKPTINSDKFLQKMYDQDKKVISDNIIQGNRDQLINSEKDRDNLGQTVAKQAGYDVKSNGGILGRLFGFGGSSKNNTTQSSDSNDSSSLLSEAGITGVTAGVGGLLGSMIPSILGKVLSATKGAWKLGKTYLRFLVPLEQTLNVAHGLWNNKANAIEYGSSQTSAGITDTLAGIASPLTSLAGLFGYSEKDMFNRSDVAKTLDQIGNNPMGMALATIGHPRKGDFANNKNTAIDKRSEVLRELIEEQKEALKKANEYEKKNGAGSGFNQGMFMALTSDAMTISRYQQEDKIRRLQLELLEMLKKQGFDNNGINDIISNDATPSSITPMVRGNNQKASFARTSNVGNSLKSSLNSSGVANYSKPANTNKLTPEVMGWINKYSQKYNVDPNLVIEQMNVESRFNPNAKSPAGAIGLMQLMPGTAKDLGVNPHNTEENVEGGIRYLSQQLKKFGREDYALGAYNAGPGRITEYGGVPPFKETQNYVKRIMSGYNARKKAMELQNGTVQNSSMARNSGGILAPSTTINNVTGGSGGNTVTPSSRGAESSFITLNLQSLRQVPTT